MEVCRCKVDYVLSEDGTRCLKAANSVGEDCQENLQCQEFLRNTVCQNNVCTCIEDYHRRGPVCIRDVGRFQNPSAVTVRNIFCNSTFNRSFAFRIGSTLRLP